MAARTDHDRRDAQHAARATIAIAIQRYVRRITEEAYAHIEERATAYDGQETIDWSTEGRLAANQALGSYGVIEPTPVIDQPAIEVGNDPAETEEDPGLRHRNPKGRVSLRRKVRS